MSRGRKDKVMMGAERKSLVIRRRRSPHAYTRAATGSSRSTSGDDPSTRRRFIRAERALGMVMQLPRARQLSMTSSR